MDAEKLNTLTIDQIVESSIDVSATVLPEYQKTIAKSVTLSGTGLHSGNMTSVTVHPAPENSGIKFRKGDVFIPGLAECVVDTSRGTTLGVNGACVQTIEHIMAALRGMGVDNAVVDISGPELPALDGSALPYCRAIVDVGLVRQDVQRKTIQLNEPVYVRHKDSFILAIPSDVQRITYVLNYKHPLIGRQSKTYVLDEWNFAEEIAPARTFVLYEEVAALLERGLSKGGSIENAIVLWQDRISSEVRYSDELVRHKVMDLVGDVALIGGLLQAEILAVKSGHALNVAFAQEITRSINLN